uniref:Putative AC transposase n=1 Tax=Lygus hesperus TaxID=30085 RepID=A0A0A9WY46_LYGHE
MKYMGCAAHKLNLIVEKGLDIQEPVIAKIKRNVTHFKSSTKAWNKLIECQSQENISTPKKCINSMPTRWNSVYYMVRRFVELENPIKIAVALIAPHLPVLTPDEWKICKSLCVILEPFEEMTLQLSKQGYPPASSVIVMINGLIELLRGFRKRDDLSSVFPVIDVLLAEIIKEDRFRNIESSGTLSTCTFLDPRYKLDGFNDSRAASNAQATVKNLIMEKISTDQDDNDPKTPTEKMRPVDKISVFDGFVKRKEAKSGLNKSELAPQ